MSALAASIVAAMATDGWLALLLQLALLATAVAAVVLAGAFALRRTSAPVRAAWLLAGVATLLLLPAVTLVARATPFGFALVAVAAPAPEQELAVQTKVGLAPLTEQTGDPIAVQRERAPQSAHAARAVPPAATTAAGAASRMPIGSWLACAWLAAAALEALLQLRAAFAAARLRRRSVPAVDAAALAEVAALARELGLRTAPQLRFSSELPCPATIGAWRPAVVLPQRALAAPSAARVAVLRHELVHIALGHPQQALGIALLRVLFAWHPLVRRVARKLAHVHEELADNGAIAGGTAPLAYARTLLSFAAASRGLARAPQALFAVGQSPLARRIERLTDPEPETMIVATTRTRAAVAAAAIVLTTLPFAVRIAPAQETAAGAANTKAPDPRDPATYMPRARGTHWSWRATWTGDDGKPYEHVHHAEVFGEVPLGDTDRTCTQLVFANNETCEYWSAGPDGLLQHDNAYIGERGVAARGTMRWLAAPVGAQTHWEWDSEMGCQTMGDAPRPDPESLRVHHVADLVAFDETVTVPAGTFHCAHVRVTETNRDWKAPHTIELWFGRGTGVVQRIDSQIGKRELIAFTPGEPVPDRDVVLQQQLAVEGRSNRPTRVEWLARDEWSCHVQGDFAVVWQDEGARPRCFHVDRTAAAFAPDDVAFWSSRGAATAESSGPNGGELLRFGEVAARLEAMRAFALPAATKWRSELSQTVGKSSVTVEVKCEAAAADGTARWASCRFERSGGVLKSCTLDRSPLQPKGG